jgi:hypothetical protein
MSTQIQITPKSGLTVGTTAVTSGTDTRVFFQQGGVLQQDANFTFNNTQKRLQLKATTGNGGNDVPFLIRNSADNLDIVRIRANGDHVLGSDSGTTLTLSAKSGFSFTTLNLNGQGNTERVALRQTLNRLTFTHTNSDTVSSTLTTTGLAIGFGDIAATAKLDIKAQGALSTDIALRVRNSADTANLFSVQGDGIANVKTRMTCGSQGMTDTGGALFVYAGNSADFMSRWFNTAGAGVVSIRTVSNGGQLTISSSTGVAGITLDGQNSNAITLGAGRHIVFDTATGTKIGTATTEKFSFWNATPIVQPTTGIAAATFVTNTSGILNDSATFDGYTIGQVVKALRNVGILA